MIRGRRALVVGACLVLPVGVSAALQAQVSGASGNLLPNGTFEGGGSGSLAGWKPSNAALMLKSDGAGGGFAAGVSFSGTGTSFNIHASPRPVTSTMAGTTYTAAGSVRSDTPGNQVCLKLVEYSSGGANVGHAQQCRRTTSGWTAFAGVSYTTKQSGGAPCGFVVFQSAPAAGASFEVDNLSLVAGGGSDPVIAAAGDIACDPADSNFNNGNGTSSHCRELATSDLVVADPSISAVLALGDNQYGCGGYTAYQQSFDPSWGRFKSMIEPVPGNHEYQTSGGTDCAAHAAGYFRYFGSAAGNANGDYAWNIGAWHMIALNGDCGDVGGCDAGSPQGTFLQNNLGSSQCTLAYWHQPYYDGTSSPSSSYKYFWQTLYNADADIVLNGHLHTYARFAPQDAAGNVDSAKGVRQFIVGTGGDDLFSLNGSHNVQFTTKAFGILKLTLHPTSYDWKFVNTSGNVLDSGSAPCS